MSSHFSLNEEQPEIVNLVLEGHNVIICGQAGVGKTRVINVLENNKNYSDMLSYIAIWLGRYSEILIRYSDL